MSKDYENITHSPFGGSIDPDDVLYFYDEPLIFTAKTPISHLLCSKVDERNGISHYLAVSTNDTVISRLKSGRMSLRSAFYQTWCWIIETDDDFAVCSWTGRTPEEIPEQYFPDPGYGLYHHHGIIIDAYSEHLRPAPFMSVHFKGGDLKEDAISFGVFRNLVDEAYGSIRKIFLSALNPLAQAGVSENTIARILQIPVRPPKFASLTLDIEMPTIDLKAVKRPPEVDIDTAKKDFSEASSFFIDAAKEITTAAKNNSLNKGVASEFSETINIMSQIVPTQDTSFDVVEISAQSGNERRSVIVDAQTGYRIKEASRVNNLSTREIIGTIVELSVRSNSFIMKTPRGREITCSVTGKEIKEALPAMQDGMTVKVSGRIFKRKRRDFVAVKYIELPGGIVIKAQN